MNLPRTKVVASYLWIFSSFSSTTLTYSSATVRSFVFVASNNVFRRRRSTMSDESLMPSARTSVGDTPSDDERNQIGMPQRHDSNDNDDSHTPNRDYNAANRRSQKRSRRQKRPPNRPGRNSYLKVLLDDRTIDILHQMSLNVQSKIVESSMRASVSSTDDPPKIEAEPQNTECSPKSSESTTTPALPTSSRSTNREQKKELSYKPRSRDSLHMTLFFGGETICALPTEELQNWHRRVRQRLETSGFYLDCSEENSTSAATATNNKKIDGGGDDEVVEDVSSAGVRAGDDDDDDENKNYEFVVQGLRVFPPQRKNLVVAILEAKQEWHDLYGDLRQIALDETCSPQLAAKMVEYSNSSKEKWIAHVTLGNFLRGGSNRKSDRTNLDDTLLKPIFDSTVNDMLALGNNEEEEEQQQEGRKEVLFRAKTTGIGMGGPIPKHQLEDLDWNFHFLSQADK